MKRILILFLLVLALFFGNIVLAQESDPRKTDLEKKIQEYQTKLNQLGQEKNTLSSQIQVMDTQIYLTGLKIEETQQKIVSTQKEIEILENRIGGLDSSLNHLSKQLLQRIAERYKTRQATMLDILLDSDDAQDFANRFKYYKTAQENNEKLLIQVQETKSNFEEQKKLREDKKTQLDTLTKTLAQQEINLNNQKVSKQKLLTDTQSDEKVYQQLLQQARVQLSAFKSFVQGSGVGSIIGANALGSGSDGAYFSQRDARWASQTIGNSSENILDVGCLLTSIAMVLKKNGVDTSPSAIASNSNYFSLNTAFMKYRKSLNPWPNGLNNDPISISEVDKELEQGHYVIVGINYGGCKSTSDHFVVLTKKDGNDYKMHDPLYGPDINFSSHYSQICWAEVFK